jgi:hypothetical protein
VRTRRAVASFVGLVAGLVPFGVALARPGGGGSYHGGAGGGGRGGGFGGGVGFGGGGFARGASHFDGGSTHSGMPDFLAFFLIAVALLVIFTVVRRQIALRSPAAADSLAWRSFASVDPLAALQARDPALTAQSIEEHVRPMAELLRTAWCAGDMRSARPFVSDAVYSRFQVQLQLMRQENRRNVMGDARLLAVQVESSDDEPPLDVVHVRVTAEARDTEVPWGASEAQVQAALAQTTVEPYTEVWSIVRRRGAPTKPSGFAVGRACPSCGAPLPAEGEAMRCRYCNALVCSGEHDWVLAEITQLVEWRPFSGSAAGLVELRSRDPGVAREILEDRASYLFWRWVLAGRSGSLAPLRKCASTRLLASGARLERTRGVSDIAVGGADLLGCAVGGQDGFDRVEVLVAWSARFAPGAASTPAKTLLRLSRKSGVMSKPSMTALVCQACGAPLGDSDSTRCDYCGVELAAGDQAWILEDLG